MCDTALGCDPALVSSPIGQPRFPTYLVNSTDFSRWEMWKLEDITLPDRAFLRVRLLNNLRDTDSIAGEVRILMLTQGGRYLLRHGT